MKAIYKNGKLYECSIDGVVMQNGKEVSERMAYKIQNQVMDLYPNFYNEMKNNVTNSYLGMNIFWGGIMFLIYNTDVWHTHGSKKLIGLSESKDKAINLCEQYAERENETLSFNSILSLKTMLQTQEYDGTGEFLIKKIEINTLQTHCLELPFYRLWGK